MDFNKKRPIQSDSTFGITPEWPAPEGIGKLLGMLGLPALRRSTQIDEDFIVIDPDGHIKCLSREAALTYTGDQRFGHGQEEPDEYIHICGSYPCKDNSHRTTRAQQHHVCRSETCVHDNVPMPGANQQQTSTVVPLWESPLVK